MMPLNGLHLLMTLRSFDELTPEAVDAWLRETPDAIRMTRITEPVVQRIGGELRGFAVIAESHLALHQKGPYVYADVFSCKPFSPGRAIEMTKQLLSARLIEWSVLKRRSESSA